MKDHNYGVPIVDIKFHESSRNVISSCTKILKIWDIQTSQLFCSIEPQMESIDDICVKDKSGMVFVAGEQKKLSVFYIPGLGHAPAWCRFLDNLTEELEESKQSGIFTDYKFVTRNDLKVLGFEKMIGTPYLRAYMHGFFMDVRLYNKIRVIANPNEYQNWRKDKVKQKMEEKRQSRITLQRKLPKVNKSFAAELLVSTGKKNSPSRRFIVWQICSAFHRSRFCT